MMQRVREWARVNQLLRIEPRGRRRGDVAHVVHAAALGGEAEALQLCQHVDQILRHDLANLDVRARGDGGLAVAELVGEVGQAGELRGGQFAGGDAAAQHETVLRRRDVKHPEVAEAKRVLLVREFVGLRVFEDAIPTVERILRVFPDFLLGHIAQRKTEDRLFRFFSREVRAALGWIGRQLPRAVRAHVRNPAALRDAGHEAGEIFFLLGGEFSGSGLGRFNDVGFGAHASIASSRTAQCL